MELILSNPIGLWALLGIPIVLLIHFLQRQSQEVTISTLFLLEQMQRESVEGRKFERIRSSVPLWLQLLMVLLLTWLLVQPRWLRSDSVQPLAVVLDNSASMTAFETEARELLISELEKLSGSVARTEFYVIESSLSAGNLYRGTNLDELKAALDQWKPVLGEHEFEPSLRVARNLVGRDGIVVLVTDHVSKQLPFDATLLAVGSQKPNLGFAGLTVKEEAGTSKWTAIVRNYHDAPVERQWFLASGNQRSAPQTIKLAPSEIRVIEGPFPSNTEFCTLHLEPDAFSADDVLPMAQPKPRMLNLRSTVAPVLAEQAAQVAGSIQTATLLEPESEQVPDITLASYNPISPRMPTGNAVVFLEHRIKQNRIFEGRLIAENHPLIEHLNWEPLVVRRSLQIPRRDADTVLLWQDTTPLIMLREQEGSKQLLFNFDLAGSNALKLPAFIVLVHRYAEQIRQTKPVLERKILETGQPLNLTISGVESTEPLTISFRSWDGSNNFEREAPLEDAARETAPIYPGYLTVSRGDEKILEASTFFADTREADLSQAATENRLAEAGNSLVERHTEQDMNWTLWVLLLSLVLIASWIWIARRNSQIYAGTGELSAA